VTIDEPKNDTAIDYFSLGHPFRGLASKVSLQSRQKMFGIFMNLLKPSATTTVLDVGVTPDRSLAESNFFEELYPHKEMLTATSIEDASFLSELYPGLTFVQTGKSVLPFDDQSFDIVVSFAVLEHVGTRAEQTAFVHELARVGKQVFVTTPDKAFPIEVHTFWPFLHWLPQPLHQRFLRLVGMSFWAKTENLNLLDKHTIRELFPAGMGVQILHKRLLGFSSNLMAHGVNNGKK
jgi:hypothetical protein